VKALLTMIKSLNTQQLADPTCAAVRT
jgi:hypothetical protein